MKRIITILLIVFVSLPAFSQQSNIPVTVWVKQAGGVQSEQGQDICVDKFGNVYVTGIFESTIDFGNGKTLISRGGWDTYAAKYTEDGECLWAKQFGGVEREKKICIINDEEGNIYVAGNFRVSIEFDNGTKYKSRGTWDLFIAKYTAEGVCLWTSHAGGSVNDGATDICIDKDGALYITGEFMSTCDFGNGVKLYSNGITDIFVAKYDNKGKCLWAKGAGGYNCSRGYGVCLDEYKNIYITGFFYGDADFKNGWVIQSKGDRDIFIAKYNNNGICRWAKGIGSMEKEEEGKDIAYQNGNVYVTGQFRETADFGNGIQLISKGGRDGFLVKYSSDGVCSWALQVGAEGGESGQGLAFDEYSNILLTGYFNLTVDFGNNIQLTSYGTNDFFISKYDSGGNCLWAKQAGGPNSDAGYKVCTNKQGAIYAAGMFSDTADFGGGFQLESIDNPDAFVLKLGFGCDETAFIYHDFGTIENLRLVGSAEQNENVVRLSHTYWFTCGAIWYDKRIPIKNGFITTFKFSLSKGKNNSYKDGSIPGADGIAFVIQNSGLNQLGGAGYGIGYDGIKNSLAVEFDTFANDSTQWNNMRDPNGNHIAVQSNGKEGNSTDHGGPALLAISKDIIEMVPDGTIYYAKIDYNIVKNTLRIYLDTTGGFHSPALVVPLINLSSLLELEDDEYAYVGFTSATGNAWENHDLLSWELCPMPAAPKVGVEWNPNISDLRSRISVYPNPFTEAATIRYYLEKPAFAILKIYDVLGRELSALVDEFQNPGEYKVFWDAKSCADGIYYYTLYYGDTTSTGSMVLIR